MPKEKREPCTLAAVDRASTRKLKARSQRYPPGYTRSEAEVRRRFGEPVICSNPPVSKDWGFFYAEVYIINPAI